MSFPLYYILALCLVCAITDARTGRIYNVATLPSIAVGLAYGALVGGQPTLAASIAGCLAGLVPFALAARRGWVGAGDVKLFAAIGALGGFYFLLNTLFIAFALAALYGLGRSGRRAGGLGPSALARSAWSRLRSGESLAGRPIRMGVFVLAGAAVSVLVVSAPRG